MTPIEVPKVLHKMGLHLKGTHSHICRKMHMMWEEVEIASRTIQHALEESHKVAHAVATRMFVLVDSLQTVTLHRVSS